MTDKELADEIERLKESLEVEEQAYDLLAKDHSNLAEQNEQLTAIAKAADYLAAEWTEDWELGRMSIDTNDAADKVRELITAWKEK